jgi:hypothetical protein
VSGRPLRLLGAVLDGQPLAEEDARALWERFSAYMDEHKGDLAGFAKEEGFASVHPAMEKGLPVLVASRSAPQKAYTTAGAVPPRGGGGSSGHQVERRGPPAGGGRRGKPGKTR